MKRSYVSLAFAVLCTVVVLACQHKGNNPAPATTTGNNNGGNNGGGSNVDTGICFTRDILPIFVSNCAKAGCHDAISKMEGYQFTDYNTIVAKNFVAGNANATELYEKITEDKPDKIMPPLPSSPLTAAQIALIRRWINEGAKNTSNCGTLCDTNKIAYATNIQPIFDKYCKGCHSGGAAPKGILLDTYVGVTAAANSSSLLGAMKHSAGFTPMPQGGAKLSNCEIRQVEKWIEAGKLNN